MGFFGKKNNAEMAVSRKQAKEARLKKIALWKSKRTDTEVQKKEEVVAAPIEKRESAASEQPVPESPVMEKQVSEEEPVKEAPSVEKEPLEAKPAPSDEPTEDDDEESQEDLDNEGDEEETPAEEPAPEPESSPKHEEQQLTEIKSDDKTHVSTIQPPNSLQPNTADRESMEKFIEEQKAQQTTGFLCGCI